MSAQTSNASAGPLILRRALISSGAFLDEVALSLIHFSEKAIHSKQSPKLTLQPDITSRSARPETPRGDDCRALRRLDADVGRQSRRVRFGAKLPSRYYSDTQQPGQCSEGSTSRQRAALPPRCEARPPPRRKITSRRESNKREAAWIQINPPSEKTWLRLMHGRR
jgi:hypothetical protein